MAHIIPNLSEKNAYMRLYTRVRSEITDGIYPYNSKLPSKRTMADLSGVSTVTVEHAYSMLCDEGYIEARERRGYFVVFHVGDAFLPSPISPSPKKYSAPFERSTVEDEGTDTDFPFSVLVKTMRKVMSDCGEGILEKSPNGGRDELRSAIGDYLKKNRGIFVRPEQIVIGSGSEYLYRLAVELLGRDKVYAIESPSYKKIEQVYNASGVKLEKLRLGADGIESGELLASRAQVLHISPYRSFPSGVTASASKRHEYLHWASQKGRFIIEDDFESEFSVSKKPEDTVFSASDSENVIYVNTFSKTVSPSLRVGYMVLPERLLEDFSEKLGFCSCTVPTYIQLVLARLIADGDFSRHINRVRRRKRNAQKSAKSKN